MRRDLPASPPSSLRRQAVRAAVVLALAAVVCGPLAVPVTAQEATCYRMSVDGVSWVSSMDFDPPGRLLLADPKQGKLLALDPRRGGAAEAVDLAAAQGAEQPYVVAVTRADGNYLLRLSRGRLQWLNPQLAPSGAVLSERHDSTGSGVVGTLYDTAMLDGYTYAYGSLREGPQDLQDPRPFKLGFLRVPNQTLPAGGEMLLPMDRMDYYVIGHHYVTATRDYAVFLRMDREPSLYRVAADGRPQRLETMPEAFASAPDLAVESAGPDDTRTLFQELESRSIAVGVWGLGDLVYMLGRTPDADGISRFSLTAIDPRHDQLVGATVELPLVANHVNVAVGDDYWYFLEKGPVEGWGKQEVRSLVAVPTAVLADGAAVKLGACEEVSKLPAR